ncbi:MAG: 6-phosphogluconolactonase [Candidatus Peregrinibacteria bacterium]
MSLQTMIATSETEFIRTAANETARHINKNIASRGQCLVGLSGGSTPGPVYNALVALPIEWAKVFLFLVDERYVPANEKESNQRLIRETLLSVARIPEKNLLFPDTTLPYDRCAASYDQVLSKKFRDSTPDLVILGMGEDGHIASLFPPLADDDALDPQHAIISTETDRFAVRRRISATLPVLASARSCMFLLKGEAKQKVWQEMTQSKEDERRWPAKRIIRDTQCIALFCP